MLACSLVTRTCLKTTRGLISGMFRRLTLEVLSPEKQYHLLRLEINVFIHASTSKCLCIKIVNMLPACLRFKFIIPVYVGHWLYYAKPSTNVNFWMFTILIIVLAIISVLVLDLLSQDSLPFWHWESRALQKNWQLKSEAILSPCFFEVVKE